MKYLKLFESKSIKDICKEYGIENYHINADGTIDLDGSVNITSWSLYKIPLNFGNVSGFFTCSSNNLRDLIGCPKRVGEYFSCSGNYNLTSLEGCPTYIGGDFSCYNNPNLWSFDHFPRHAKWVNLWRTPILPVFNLFKDVYLADGGEFFSTSGTMMDYFWDCDPVYPNKIIKKRRMNNFLASIEKELKPEDIKNLEAWGCDCIYNCIGCWKIED